ncbi:MAG: ABC transporter permease [Rubellimicrobium sp.]|nr:ABC transporter permease [Rubellimicrobium sp.]
MTSLTDPPDQPDQRRLRSVHKVGRLATARTVMALILREMTSTYGRTPGGYLWTVLEPVAGIAVLTMIFSLMVRSPPVGNSFALFYATGLLPLTMFMTISSKVAQSLGYSKQLLAYPRVTIMDAILARLILNVMTQLLVGYIVLTGIVLHAQPDFRLIFPLAVLSYAMAIAAGLGMGIMNCYLFYQFPLWQSFWTIITRPLFLVSGVIFIPERFPPDIRDTLYYNPLVHVTGQMRRAFYPSYHGTYVTPGYVFAVALILGVIGLLFLWRYHRDILEL